VAPSQITTMNIINAKTRLLGDRLRLQATAVNANAIIATRINEMTIN
jgi:hypothetical protein